MAAAELTFVINSGLLSGHADGRNIHIRVASGGGGGAVTRHTVGKKTVVELRTPDDIRAVNNPLMTRQKANHARHIRGGPIPPGEYLIAAPARHPKLGLSAALTPVSKKQVGKRGGFFIHGRGKAGSDGCIVPLNPLEFQTLMYALSKSAGGRLRVHSIFDVVKDPGVSFA